MYNNISAYIIIWSTNFFMGECYYIIKVSFNFLAQSGDVSGYNTKSMIYVRTLENNMMGITILRYHTR